MKSCLRLSATAIAALLVLGYGCVELCGQRITLKYDTATDELSALIFYDGIYDRPDTQDGAGQIPEFVKNGNIMILDWPFHMQIPSVRQDLERALKHGDEDAALAAFLKAFLDSLVTQPVGHYRDARGRLGAVQLVKISRFSELVKKANVLVSELALQDLGKAEEGRYWGPDWKSTQRLVLEAAKRRHTWLLMEGRHLKFTFPAHPGEWARGKGQLVHELLATLEKGDVAKVKESLPLFQILAAAPLSYRESHSETGLLVSVELALPERPLTLRADLRRAYSPNLEKVVRQEVPVDLDIALARAVLKDSGPPIPPATSAPPADPGVQAVLDWGAPEVLAEALLESAQAEGGKYSKQVVEALKALGVKWNRGGGVPAAPGEVEDTSRYLDSWRDWARRVHVFPLEPDEAAPRGATPQGPGTQ